MVKKKFVEIKDAEVEKLSTQTITGWISIEDVEYLIKKQLCLFGETTFDWKSEEHLDKVLIRNIVVKEG